MFTRGILRMRLKKENTAKESPQGTQIEILGSTQVSVEDCGGVEITEYDDDTVKISSKHLVLRLFGQGLTLKKLTVDAVTISGKIASLEFERGEAKK